MRAVKTLSFALLTTLVLANCGGNQEEIRTEDPSVMGGKFDIPSWLRHIPTNWGCDSAVKGTFKGYDSAHLYSFAAKVGYEFTFTLDGTYPSWMGAIVGVYDAETGDRLAVSRKWPGTSARVVVKPKKSGKLLVAAYTATWWADGDYELYAACKLVDKTCTDNSQCAKSEFCAKKNCAKQGVCSFRPEACPQVVDPVCGCDGRTYSNGCMAASHGMNIGHAGACPAISVSPKDIAPNDNFKVSMTNGAKDTIWVSNCGTYLLERKEGNKWVPMGPFVKCFAFMLEGIKPTGTVTASMVAPEAGTYRLTTDYGVGCTAIDRPLDSNNCSVVLEAKSPEFVVEDSCWGAWLDQKGNCRTPADGVYPDKCCDDERRTKCDKLMKDYSQAIKDNQSCNPLVMAPQCQTAVPTSIACNSSCKSYINVSTTVAGIDSIVTDWSTFKCSTLPYACTKVMCRPAIGGVCELGTQNDGTCRPKYL
jgi:hypothetical protein